MAQVFILTPNLKSNKLECLLSPGQRLCLCKNFRGAIDFRKVYVQLINRNNKKMFQFEQSSKYLSYFVE